MNDPSSSQDQVHHCGLDVIGHRVGGVDASAEVPRRSQQQEKVPSIGKRNHIESKLFDCLIGLAIGSVLVFGFLLTL